MLRQSEGDRRCHAERSEASLCGRRFFAFAQDDTDPVHRGWVLVGLAILALLSVACSTSPASPPKPAAAPASPPRPAAAPISASASTASFPLTLTDDAGRQVTIPAQPRRIVSISASNTETLYALGLEEKVVGVDQYSDFPPSVAEKPRVGSFVRPDLERVVALEPDLILGTEQHLKATLPELEQRGLTVLIVNPKDIMGVLASIKMVGRATGSEPQAESLAEGMRARIESVTARVQGADPVRVFFELSPSLHTAGPGSYVDDIIRLVRGTNIAADAGKQWPQLNQEALFLADPEVILLADHSAGQTPEMVAARPGWRQITAVKNGRVVVVDPNLVNRSGPRVVEGVELIARTLHPEKVK